MRDQLILGYSTKIDRDTEKECIVFYRQEGMQRARLYCYLCWHANYNSVMNFANMGNAQNSIKSYTMAMAFEHPNSVVIDFQNSSKIGTKWHENPAHFAPHTHTPYIQEQPKKPSAWQPTNMMWSSFARYRLQRNQEPTISVPCTHEWVGIYAIANMYVCMMYDVCGGGGYGDILSDSV